LTARRLRAAAFACAGLVLLAVLAWRPCLSALGAFLVNADPPRRADIVVVLAGDYSGNRIRKAAELVKQGYAPKILVSGPAGFYGEHESDAAIRFMTRQGFPAKWFIPFPNDALSTREEAKAVAAKLRELGVVRADIVTSNYHTHRARSDYIEDAPGIEFSMVAAPDEYFTPDGWWKTREGRKTFLIEWLKTLASWAHL
jgi:uncharacterized SAM-binding protein YcdF (DUF218 family)